MSGDCKVRVYKKRDKDGKSKKDSLRDTNKARREVIRSELEEIKDDGCNKDTRKNHLSK